MKALSYERWYSLMYPFFRGALYISGHDCKIAPLCTPFLYTAVAILLPAPLISKAYAKPSAFGFKVGLCESTGDPLTFCYAKRGMTE